MGRNEHDDASTALVLDGTRMPADLADASLLRLVVIGTGTLAMHAVSEGETTIGRSKRCDILLDDVSISRRHVTLRIGEAITVEDLGSVNGTRVRGERLAPNRPVTIAIGEQFTIGTLNVVLQHRPKAIRLRRVWAHDYFEARLEEECARGQRTQSTFGVLRVQAVGPSSETALEEALGELLRDSDVLGKYGPGAYEVLLADTTPAGAADAIRRIESQLKGRELPSRVVGVCFPRDGQTPHQLLARFGEVAEERRPAADVIVGDPHMQSLHRLVTQIASSNINVMLLGETGVGKEVFARSIHRSSLRARAPFVELNCAALTESLLESELFGHEKGAFTNATSTKPGLIESAHGGTLFLDEIGDMPLATQVKLLRVIEEQRLRRVGAIKARSVDVRFVAATNCDLDAQMEAGTFRRDLYFRLNGITISIPPLRERLADLEPLIAAFIARALPPGAPPVTMSAEALEHLRSYSWPGNVRELKNVVERAVLLCNGGPIEPAHLPLDKLRGTIVTRPLAKRPFDAMQRRSAAEELEWILEALERTAGNQTHAARLLGISRRTLVNRLNEHESVYRPRKDKKKPAAE